MHQRQRESVSTQMPMLSGGNKDSDLQPDDNQTHDSR